MNENHHLWACSTIKAFSRTETTCLHNIACVMMKCVLTLQHGKAQFVQRGSLTTFSEKAKLRLHIGSFADLETKLPIKTLAELYFFIYLRPIEQNI
jgi:hypothetical protein